MGNSDPMFDPYVDALPRSLCPAEMMHPAPGAFLENIALDAEGRVYATSLNAGAILRWEEGVGGSVFCELALNPMSLERDVDGTWYVAGHSVAVRDNFERMTRSQQVWRMSADGKAEHFVDLPDARLLNGMMRMAPGVFLFADSYAATIWRLDVATRKVSQWLRHDALAPARPGEITPAANGIKPWRDKIVVSNSTTQTFVYVQVNADGGAGAVEVRQTKFATDDFFVQEDGTILATTHGLAVLRLRPDDSVEVICEDEVVRGNTAVAPGVRPGDRRHLYVVSDGGLWHGAAKLAGISRIDLGADIW